MSHLLLQDGKIIFGGSDSECYGKLHKLQPHSWDYATKYGGYQVIATDKLVIQRADSAKQCVKKILSFAEALGSDHVRIAENTDLIDIIDEAKSAMVTLNNIMNAVTWDDSFPFNMQTKTPDGDILVEEDEDE